MKKIKKEEENFILTQFPPKKKKKNKIKKLEKSVYSKSTSLFS
jgi:hypothetical protein